MVNGVIYTLGWLLCVLSGANQAPLPPLIIVPPIIAMQLLYIRKTSTERFLQDLFLLNYCLLIGFLMETLFIGSRFLSYATTNSLYPLLPPGWLLLLYPLFGLTYNHALSFLNRSLFLAALFGFFGGALSYYAGSRLSAVVIHQLFPIALFWSLFLVVTVAINRRLQAVMTHLFSQENLNNQLTVFFDAGCPICSKECCHLKKRKQMGKVRYVEFTNEEELREHAPKLSFASAMAEIHAEKATGEIIRGIDVFPELYARTDLQWLALLISAPIFHPLFCIGYKVWARYRLYRRPNMTR